MYNNSIILNKAIYKKSYAIDCPSYIDIAKVILNLLYFNQFFGSNWKDEDGNEINLADIEGICENCVDDNEDTIYVYINVSNYFISIIPGSNWDSNWNNYEFHHISVLHDNRNISIQFAIDR